MDNDAFLIKLGFQVALLRKEKGIKQIELANLCDIERSNMRRIEAGRTNPTVLTLLKICDALNISIGKLFEFE